MRAFLVLAVLGFAGAAHAQTSAELALDAAVRRAEAPATGLTLPRAEAEAYVLRSAGIARTAVERREGAGAASLGFLCGLKDSADRWGSAAVRGSDPHGRFLGAKLSFAFR
jgi:hypothetical protein